ncbi:MAG: flavin reductase family protein [Polyangiaceae bacterium]|nr:flavin reductase family protein [Polyangiaceae bacterium]
MTPEEFKEALASWATGVTVVATEWEGHRYGLTASSFTSVSLTPPLVLICVDRRAESCEALLRAGSFGVSILALGQEAAAMQMARSGEQKFEGLPFEPGPTLGQPLLRGALAHLECRTFRADDAGDHVLLLGEVHAARTHEGSPLLYARRRFHGLG